MYNVRIKIMKKACYNDLITIYEKPQINPCPYEVGATYISENATKPLNFCDSAWVSLYPYVLTLASGGSNIYDNWMQDNRSAMVSCNDGFRPVSFLLEVCD